MCEKHLCQCFILIALLRLPSHPSVFTFRFPSLFTMTVRFKWKVLDSLC